MGFAVSTTTKGWLVAAGAVLAGLVSAPVGCLVDSRCVSDLDCPYPQRCGADGGCSLECSASAPDTCPMDRPECLVSEHRCVECVDGNDCPGDDECVNHSCVPSFAPAFALVDRNPRSPTYEEEIALTDYLGDVVLIYFAGLG